MTGLREAGFQSDLLGNMNELPYILTHPLVYASALLQALITVPAGFRTDLASIPRLLWVLIPKEGKYNRAAVLHDWLYTTGSVMGRSITRGQADDAFYEAMLSLGVRMSQARVIREGLRVGGWYAWGKYRRGEVPVGMI